MEGVFDVILTDPPYGVRAGAKKVAQKTLHQVIDRDSYYPQMLGYEPNEVNRDLLELSSRMLIDGGVLVFLLHIELIDLFTSQELERLPRGSVDNRATKILVHNFSQKEYVYANEGARDFQFLDQERLGMLVPQHDDMKLEGCVLQILAAGTGRMIVKMRRKPRAQ
jgi:tRNA (guanine10-N2)-methyltransferase